MPISVKEKKNWVFDEWGDEEGKLKLSQRLALLVIRSHKVDIDYIHQSQTTKYNDFEATNIIIVHYPPPAISLP